jgi:beta-mannosidase
MTTRSTINLQGEWQLARTDGSCACTYSVPGDVHSALIKAGHIADPYFGKNELAVRWVADVEWVATTEFELSVVEAGQYYLDIDYLDTVATVKVNGIEVLWAENCFRRYRPDVTKALKVGKNLIEVLLHSNTKAANDKQARQPFFIPYSVSNNPIPNGNMLRKPQCHFGWDWNLAIVPLGLCGRFALQHQTSVRIESIVVNQQHNADGSVDLSIKIWVNAISSSPVDYSYIFNGEIKTFQEAGDENVFWHSCQFHVANPQLWWPAGQGEQHLYDLEVRFGVQVERRKIGLRKIELITDRDETGARFVFKVNGREVFCKGANWIPADALPLNATPERTHKRLQAAKDANMNMIRVWGGGYYENDVFYDICDELGLLVWQDFMFAFSLYPSTPEFLSEVRLEADYQVKRLQHHACIALWCGDNELLGALTWFEESRKNRDRYLVNYDRLNRTLEEAVKQADDTAIWWPSSPSPGFMDFGDAWHNDAKGDMHFWSVWHEGRDFEHYRDVTPRFCSEFGFQSFPSLRVCKQFADAEDMNISSDVMQHHQRNAGGNARIAETMFRYFRFPVGFENFVYVSQVQHGLAMQTAVDYWRSLKPHCMGTLMWQLNDTWPVASWSGLDHDGGWKAMHHMAKDFYAPVSVVAIPDKQNTHVRFIAINDSPQETEVHVTLERVSMDGRRHVFSQHSGTLPVDEAIELGQLNREDVPEGSMLFWSFNGIRRHFSFQPYKHLNLPKPGLSTKIKSNKVALEISVTAKALALHVMCECDVAGHFSSNVFDLLPGEARTIIFTPDNPADLKQAEQLLIVRDLYSSSH